ncbi:MAG: hypothetical protein AAF203_07105 [Pseudomonadota bacterium]
MLFDISFAPIVSLLIATLVLSIVSDFLLELFSVRLSLATGRLQSWFFESLGHGGTSDFFAAAGFQLLSFRKKAFFQQFASLVNVGSFPANQIPFLLMGSFFGIGLSVVFLFGGSLVLGLGLCLLSFILSLFSKDQLRDLGFACLGLGLFWVFLSSFDVYISQSSLNIHPYKIQEGTVFLFLVFVGLFFRTPGPLLVVLAMLHLFIGFNVLWFPALFFIHGLVSLFGFYRHAFQKRRRLYSCLRTSLILQISQLVISFVVVYFFRESLSPLVSAGGFLEAYQIFVVGFLVYWSFPLAIVLPMKLLLNRAFAKEPDEPVKKEVQKIIIDNQRWHYFSIHLSLFLLRQEYKKFSASVHTVFKMAREISSQDEDVKTRFARYQKMLVRVGGEIKELCFAIGKQRSYRWQVKEIMTYYRQVNQLELLIEDLGFVVECLESSTDEDWQKECRYWLGLQLKLFESFLNRVLEVPLDEPGRVEMTIEKSYEVLDRFTKGPVSVPSNPLSSKVYYRMTESLGTLAQ